MLEIGRLWYRIEVWMISSEGRKASSEGRIGKLRRAEENSEGRSALLKRPSENPVVNNDNATEWRQIILIQTFIACQ